MSRGPLWQVQLEAGRLEAEGITTWLPDATIKTLDPFATGALPLLTVLHVPEEEERRARELLAEADLEGATPEELTAAALATPPDPDLGITPEEARDLEGSDDDEVQERLETLARRTRWGALMVWLAPFAVYYGLAYLRLARRTGRRDARHGLTVAGLALGILLVGVFLVFLFRLGPLDGHLQE